MSGVSKTPPNSTTKTKNVLVSKRRPLGSSGRTASQESARPMSPKGEKAGGSTGVSRPSTSSRTRPGVVIAEKKSSTSAESSAKVKTENGKPKASPRNNAMSTSMIVKSKVSKVHQKRNSSFDLQQIRIVQIRSRKNTLILCVICVDHNR